MVLSKASLGAAAVGTVAVAAFVALSTGGGSQEPFALAKLGARNRTHAVHLAHLRGVL